MIKEKRRANKGNNERYIHIYYDHPIEKKFSSFSKYISYELEGKTEEYVTKREEDIQAIEEKQQTGDA